MQRHVLGDWGTTRLRLFLIERGEVAATREGPGIGALTATPGETLTSLVAPWVVGSQPLQVVLCGMVGSRNGLLETEYAAAPIAYKAWSRAVQSTRLRDLSITIATGLRDDSRPGAPDVMRGEETQIFGALHLDTDLSYGPRLFVLPGTHSKWVDVENASIARFRTALTGEVFALLRDHSILLKAAAPAEHNVAQSDAGFDAGIERSRRLPEGLLGALFEVRTAQLLQQRARGWASGFLSGLLIGAEISDMIESRTGVEHVTVIGDTALAALYERAFKARGVGTEILDGSVCVLAGLRRLQGSLAEVVN
jgi:2-dehydro-3-deoxygalactonokinase